jgi:lipoprotein NlpI
MRIGFLTIAVSAAIVATLSACVQSRRNDNWAQCRDSRDNPELRVSACTTIIQSGRENTTNLASAFIDRGTGYFEEHQYDLAIADGEQGLKLDPSNADAFVGHGNGYAMKGEHDRAIQDYGHAISLDPKGAYAYNNRGNIYRAQRQYDRAIQDYDQAIILDPQLAQAFNGRACAYCFKGEYDRAIQDYNQAISLNPTYAHAFLDRSCAYVGKGQYDNAIQDLDKAISLDPKNPHAFVGRGETYYLKGQYDRAIENLDQALSLDPKLASAFNYRGYAEFAAARFAPAAQDFEQSLTINGAQPYVVVWLHLARARAMQADGEELKHNAAKVDLKTWPGPIVAFLLKQKTAPQLKNAAAIGDQKTQQNQACEASFHLGEDAMLRNTSTEAAQLFRQARATCPVNFVEYPLVMAELSHPSK